MNSEILSAEDYVESLKPRFQGFEFSAYKLRDWFSKTAQVFFDCKEADKEACLQMVLKEPTFAAFTIFFVVKEQSGKYRLMDASFRNLGTETLEHFIARYHSQLESMTRLGIQTTGAEYIECVGHSYVEV
jgi:hypothetical protein